VFMDEIYHRDFRQTKSCIVFVRRFGCDIIHSTEDRPTGIQRAALRRLRKETGPIH